MLVYGKNVVNEILNSKTKIHKVFLDNNFNDQQILNKINKLGLKKFHVDKNKIDKMCSNSANQGIALDIEEFNYATIWTAYLNSFIIAITSTVGTLFTSSLAAFAFAKMKFKGNKILYTIFIATLMIPGQVTVIPLYTIFAKTQLTDTFIPLILPGVMINTYGVFMLRSFIVSIPNELLDAAEVDGCGYFRKYIKIILPLIKPALVTLGLFSFIGSWNNYFGQLIYISSYSNYTIPLIINAFRDPYMGGPEWGRLMAATTLSVVPIAAVYLFCQKYFVQGIATTGIK